jgi:thymidylate synthase
MTNTPEPRYNPINPHDQEYHKLLAALVASGRVKEQRAVLADGSKPKTRSLFGYQCRYDLAAGFPLVTTKKVAWHAVRTELVWMLRGGTNIDYLRERKVKIWDQWADERGELGNVYGAAWRKFPSVERHGDEYGPKSVDQLALLLTDIKAVVADPNASPGRRLVMITWIPDPAQRPPTAPMACHTLVQFDVFDGRLNCHMYQRSADVFLGVPFNIAGYALLTHLLAAVTGLAAGEFVHSFGDVHIYENHLEQVDAQLRRVPYAPPRLVIKHRPGALPWEYEPEDFIMDGYEHHPALPGEVAV